MFCRLPSRSPPSARAQRISMDAARRSALARRPSRRRRMSVLLTLTLLTAACTTAGGHSGTTAATGRTPPATPGAPLSTSSGVPSSASAPPVSISAVGDIIMGSTPQLPPDDGRHLFEGVTGRVTGTVALANMDQTLTDDAAVSKCGAGSSGCYAFRTPPAYAQWIHEAGFTIINLANNHSHDFGDAGLRDTQAALTAHGLLFTGMPGQITVQQAGPVRIAILGFAPYAWTQSLLDIPAAQQLVQQATTQADLVLVTIHAGAEGAEEGHVRPGTEIFLGENRGDPMAFSRAVIDAGADAVLGSGPHVLRGMEWYRGRLIAYSMGNFVGYHTLSISGPLGVGGILTVTLAPDGTWRGGDLTGTQMIAPGLPQIDPSQQAVALVGDLSRTDFGACGVTFTPTGDLNPPTC
jgi:capsule synthesis protein PGA_cap